MIDGEKKPPTVIRNFNWGKLEEEEDGQRYLRFYRAGESSHYGEMPMGYFLDALYDVESLSERVLPETRKASAMEKALLDTLREMVTEDRYYPVAEIRDAMAVRYEERPTWLTPAWIGRQLQRFGYERRRGVRGRREYRISPETAQEPVRYHVEPLLSEPGLTPEEIGRRIRELRERKEWSRKELAEKIGVSYQTIHRYETEHLRPSTPVLKLIQILLS